MTNLKINLIYVDGGLGGCNQTIMSTWALIDPLYYINILLLLLTSTIHTAEVARRVLYF
jgi:hypothetical protein